MHVQPATLEEVRRFFNDAPESPYGSIDPEWVARGLLNINFPKRNLPHTAALAFIGASTLEALLSNKPRHYTTPGRMAPENRLWFFDCLSGGLRDFKDGRATHKAVGQIYHHPFGIWNKSGLPNKLNALLHDLTFNTDHALGLISRFLIIKRLLSRLLSSKKVSRLGSIACGAADAVLAATSNVKYCGTEVYTGFFDINEDALAAVQLALNNEKRFSSVNPGQCFFTNVIKNQNWFQRLPIQGLELSGLIDYIPNDKLPRFLRNLRNPELKFLITCNILRKPGFTGWHERLFIKHALQWPMYYRTHAELAQIFSQAGYGKVRFINEPYGLFTVILWLAE